MSIGYFFRLGSSPRTTIFGIIRGLFLVLIPIFQKDGFQFSSDWPFLLGAILTYISGRIQKDSNSLTKGEERVANRMVLGEPENKNSTIS